MAGAAPHFEIEGYWRLRRAIRKATDADMPRRLGQAHKNVGEFIADMVDRESDPAAVGSGFGATVRGSASKREVLIRVGHGARQRHVQQWGKNPIRSWGARAPARPYIVKIVHDHEDEIRQELLEQVMAAMEPAFYDAKVSR